ncbi:O-acyltransferase like protein-like [Haemaphysalis longicornis]
MGYVTLRYGEAKIGLVTQLAHWILSFALTGFVLFITLPWNRGNPPDEITTAIYAGFHRFVWALGLAWPSYACATGRGGLLNAFFSWKAFMPISRLVYSIYLVHVPLLYLRMGIMKTHINMNEFFQLNTAIGLFGMSLFLGYLLYISTEAPVGRIENAIFETTVNRAQKASKMSGTKKVPLTGNDAVKKVPSETETKIIIENEAKKMENAGIDNAAYESEKSKL